MKKNLFDLPQSEKNRILEMHINRTSNHYLLDEQQTTGNTNLNEFPCKSETINITNEPQIRLTSNQQFGDMKSATPNILLKEFRSTGDKNRAPILYIKNLRPNGTATTQQIKTGRANNVAQSDNIWLSKVEYIKITDKTTNKSVYFPAFLTLTHMFCAKFENPERLGDFVDVNSAIQGSQVYNYYRFPIISTGTLTIDTLVSSGLNAVGILDGLLGKEKTFALSKLGNIPQLLFGENFIPSAGFPNNDTRYEIRNIIIQNQPKS